MDKIPVSFTYKDKEYKGHLAAIAGAGGSIWHLMIDNYYYGQLVFTQQQDFTFTSNVWKDAGELSKTFGEIIILWYQ